MVIILCTICVLFTIWALCGGYRKRFGDPGVHRLTVYTRSGRPSTHDDEDEDQLLSLGEAHYQEREVTGYTILYANGTRRHVRK